MDAVRISVIGAGLIGSKHAALIDESDFCDLAGVCDIDPAGESIADRLHTGFYTHIDSLLDRERPDGVIIAVPNSEHGGCAEICASKSVHMLIEKPIADSVDEALRIDRIAGRNEVSVLVGHHRRHNPLVKKSRLVIQDGDIGRLVGVSILWALCKPDNYFATSWRRERPGGGPTLINLIHELDTLRYVCGEISEVYARSSSMARGLDVEDSMSISLLFENGAIGTIMASDASPSPWSYETSTMENPFYYYVDENCYHFLGSAGALAFPRMELWRYPDRAKTGWQFPLEKTVCVTERADPLKAQLKHFCNVIIGTEKPVTDALDGTRSLAVALAVLESARSGNPVRPTLP